MARGAGGERGYHYFCGVRGGIDVGERGRSRLKRRVVADYADERRFAQMNSMSQKICILCPGQGAQVVGMGRDFVESSDVARAVFEKANAILGFDLASICFGGPEEKLNQTDISQPAIYVTSVAAFRAAVAAGVLNEGGDNQYAGLSLG